MKEAPDLTFAELATKLRLLRQARKELGEQIDAIIELLPEDPAMYGKTVKEWAVIRPALDRAHRTLVEGIGHVMPNSKCSAIR